MDAETWLARFAAALGADQLSVEDLDAVLDVARTAAHASERRAAPAACWLAARAGLSPTEALARIAAMTGDAT